MRQSEKPINGTTLYQFYSHTMSRDSPIFSKTSNALYSTLTPLSNRLQADPPSSRSSKYRYSSLTRNQNSEQAHVASALSKQYRSALKTPLPELKPDKVHLLEQWLNDALEGDLPEDGHRRQPLKILKSYELDKGSLRNQNISQEQITKLYNGLFVYSSGIKNAFEEMFTMAVGQTGSRLEKTYWQVFIKLLESTIPVKTCFQITEQTYIREIAELRKTIAGNKHAAEVEREGHENVARKLKREIEEGNYRFKQFESDYNITKATLEMTEITFNEEVSLRLKFEQKINQVYSSYQELQEKYEKLRTELSAKKDSLAQAVEEKKQLSDRLNEEVIKNNDLIQRHERMENSLHDLQEQIVIKNQEIMDIQLENCSVEQQKAKEEFAIEELMLTIRMLKKNQIQQARRFEQAQNAIRLHEQNIGKLKNSLDMAREKNDELYIQFHQASLKIVPVEQDKLRQSVEIVQLKNRLTVTEHKNQLLAKEKEEIELKYSSTCTQLQDAEKDLEIKREMIRKYEQNLTEMKEVKDRFERINSTLTLELKNQRRNYEDKIERLSENKVKMYEMKTESDKLKAKVKTLELNLANAQEDKTATTVQIDKIKQIQTEVLAQKHSTIQQCRTELEEALAQVAALQESNNKKDSDKLKKLQQITYLRKINAFLEQDVKQKKQTIGKMAQEIEAHSNTIVSLQKELEERQFAKEKKDGDEDCEKNNLRQLLAQQKTRIQERADYVHPMLVEDMRAELSRMHEKIDSIHKKTKHITDTYDEMEAELNRYKRQIQLQKEELLSTAAAKEELVSEATKAKEQTKTLILQHQQKMQEKQRQIIAMRTEQKDNVDYLTAEIGKYQAKGKNDSRNIANLTAEISVFRQKEKIKQPQIQKNDTAAQTEQPMPNHNAQTANLRQSQTHFHDISSSIRPPIRPAQQQTPLQKSKRFIIKKFSSQEMFFPKQQDKPLPLEPPPQIQQQQAEPPQHPKAERPQKKIEGRQFKKALRLTFMRR